MSPEPWQNHEYLMMRGAGRRESSESHVNGRKWKEKEKKGVKKERKRERENGSFFFRCRLFLLQTFMQYYMLVTLRFNDLMMFKERRKGRKSCEEKERKKKSYEPLTTSIGFALDTNFVGSLYTFVDFEGLYLDTVEEDNDGNNEVESGDCFEAENLDGDEKIDVTKWCLNT